MNKVKVIAVNARRKPVQERSTFTVESILEATIQVLLEKGSRRLTTTAVAERAGVSVGTLYQYFPNREALLRAVLEQHLNKMVVAILTAYKNSKDESYVSALENIIDAFVDAKTSRIDVSMALYAVAGELDSSADLRKTVYSITDRVFVPLLKSIPTARFDDASFSALMLYSIFTGSSKAVLERGGSPQMVRQWRIELKRLCVEYVRAHVH